MNVWRVGESNQSKYGEEIRKGWGVGLVSQDWVPGRELRSRWRVREGAG